MTNSATSLHWRISSFSGTGSTCVEVAAEAGTAHVRNSNAPDAGTLSVPRGVMADWVAAVDAGVFDDLAD